MTPAAGDEAVPLASRGAARPRHARTDVGRPRGAETLPAPWLDGRRGVVPVPGGRVRPRVARDRAGSARLRQERLAAAGLLVRGLHRRPRGAAAGVRARRSGQSRRAQPRRQCRAALRRRAPGAGAHGDLARRLRHPRRGIGAGAGQDREMAGRARGAAGFRHLCELRRGRRPAAEEQSAAAARQGAVPRRALGRSAAGRARSTHLRPAAQAAVPLGLPDRGDVRGVAQHHGSDAVDRRGGVEHPEVARRSSRRARARPTASPG